MSPSLSSLDLWPVKREHLRLLRKWRNLPAIYRWCRQFEPITEEQHEAWFQSLHNNPSTKMYVVMRPNADGTGQPIGVCGLTSIDYINRRAEFSLYIAPDFQCAGYGIPALKLLCKRGFETLNLNCIWGEVFSGNPALQRFKTVGFVEEGKRRQFYYRDGKYIDAVMISLLKDEFKIGA